MSFVRLLTAGLIPKMRTLNTASFNQVIPSDNQTFVGNVLRRLQSLRHESRIEFKPIICSSRWIYFVVWCTILLSHFILGFLSFFYAFFYLMISDPSPENRLAVGARQLTSFHPLWQIATVISMGLYSIGHFYIILRAFIASIIQRRLTFSTGKVSHKSNHSSDRSLWYRLKTLRSHFGLNGKYFIAFMDFREIIEICFQTYQAYSMSSLVPAEWIKTLVVSFIVLNAWSTPVIEYFLRNQRTWERLMLLVTDGLLDFFMSYIINIIIIFVGLSHIGMNFEGRPFELNAYYSPMTRPMLFASADMVCIGHFGEFLTISIQCLGLIISLETIKSVIKRPSATVSIEITEAKPNDKCATPPQPKHNKANNKAVGSARHEIPKLHIVFLVYGVALIIIHSLSIAGLNRTMSEEIINPCHLELYPWFATKERSCAAIEINCYRHGINGSAQEIDQILQPFIPSAVYMLHFTHCASLEIPSSLRFFSGLYNLDMYNSTVSKWNSDAALMNLWQPKIKALYVVNTRGFRSIPEGLMAGNFPSDLLTIHMIKTDLEDLPEDLETKWHDSMYILQFVYSKLTRIPSSLAKIKLFTLNLYGNDIASISPELLSNRQFDTLNLANNPKLQLPSDVSNFTVFHLDLRDTNVTVEQAPQWLDNAFFKSTCTSLAGTGFCPHGEESPLWASESSDLISRCGKYKYYCRIQSSDGESISGFSFDEYKGNYLP